MWFLSLIAESVGLIVGSLAVALLLWLVIWRAAVGVHHPRWAAPLLLLIGVAALFVHLPESPLLRMIVAFTVLGALPLALAAGASRADSTPRPHISRKA